MIGNPLIIKKEFRCSIEMLWNAISNSSAIRNWFFEVTDFELKEGESFEFYAGKYLHTCTITDVFLYHKLSYTWEYPLYEGMSMVIFEIHTISPDQLVSLELTHQGIASFPQDIDDFKRSSFEASWEDVLENGLRKYVEYQE